MCFGGGDSPPAPAPIVFPGPTPQETALREEELETLRFQRALLEQQIQEQNLLSPILFEEFGLEAIRSPVETVPDTRFEDTQAEIERLVQLQRGPESTNARTAEIAALRQKLSGLSPGGTLETGGEITGFNRLPDPTGDLRDEIELSFLERTQAALEGRLDVNPGLLRQLGESRDLLNASLLKQLGPGFETSEPGIRALDRFSRSESEVLEGARRGDLTLFEQLSLGAAAESRAAGQFLAGGSQGVTNRNLPITSALGGNVAGLAGVGAQFAQDRSNQFSASSFNANAVNQFNINKFNAEQSTLGSLFGAGGSIGGSIAGALITRSSREIKDKIDSVDREEILTALNKLDVDKWSYNGIYKDGEEHIGPYAEDVQRALGVGDSKVINLMDMIGALLAAVQALSVKVQKLETA